MHPVHVVVAAAQRAQAWCHVVRRYAGHATWLRPRRRTHLCGCSRTGCWCQRRRGMCQWPLPSMWCRCSPPRPRLGRRSTFPGNPGRRGTSEREGDGGDKTTPHVLHPAQRVAHGGRAAPHTRAGTYGACADHIRFPCQRCTGTHEAGRWRAQRNSVVGEALPSVQVQLEYSCRHEQFLAAASGCASH